MTEITANVQSVADQLHRLAIQILRDARQFDPEIGLPPMQLSALSVLVFGGPHPLSKLALAEQVSAPTMHTTVNSLCKKGLVTRARDKRDRRVVYVVATRAGIETLQQARVKRLTAITEKLDLLPSETLTPISEALATLGSVYAD